MAVSISVCAAGYGAVVPVYLVPMTVLGLGVPIAGTYDNAPTSPVTDVGLVTVRIVEPAGPTSTPKLVAAPKSTGVPGVEQLAGGTVVFTVKVPEPDLPLKVAVIVAVPADTTVATPVVSEVHATAVVMSAVVLSE
jgi:hypothetical protein